MESGSRLLLAAFACWLAGPLAALAAIHVVAGRVVGEVALDSANVGEIIAGTFVAALFLGGIGALAGLAATIAALVLSRSPHPGWASAACLVLTMMWSQVVFVLDVGLWISMLLLGLVAGLVRLADGLIGGTRGPERRRPSTDPG
jgi:hypothetical protein